MLHQQGVQVGRAQRGRPLGDQAVELVLVLPPGPVGGVAGVVGQLGAAHGPGQAAEHHVVVGGDEDHLAVGGGVHVGRGDVGQHRPGALPDVAGGGVLGDQRLHHGQDRLIDGRVDHLAPPGPLPVVQGGERAQAGEDGGQGVADADAHPAGRGGRVPHHVAQAAHGLAHRAEAGLAGVGPGLPVAGDPHQDEPGVDGAQLLIGQAPALQGAGPEVLDYDVGGGGEPPDQVLALGCPQVDGDRLLVAGHHRPPQGLAARPLPAPLPHRVAHAGLLDLDDLGPEVGQELAAEGPGQQHPHLQHPQVGQGEGQALAAGGAGLCSAGRGGVTAHCGLPSGAVR